MELQNGLNEVYVPECTPAATLIFVHGLFGHPQKTWTKGRLPAGVFWPKDLLPPLIPNVSIYSWGYDADIEKFMSSAGRNSLHWHGLNLMNDLADLRDNDEGAGPFIFVVHSLGGLVVKDALNKSAEAVKKRFKDVLPATYGICFLGTPHRGSKSASMGRWAFRLTEILAGQRANTKLLRALERNSESLERISDSFYKTISKHEGLRICSFVEEKEVRKLGFIGTHVVPPDSAIIGYIGEEVRTIAENHSDMSKFGSDSESGFKRVTGVLKRWVKEIETSCVVDSSKDYQDCLSSLDDRTARMRIEQVKARHNHTFEWLYEPATVPFCGWLQSDIHDNAMFWITGKPGSGKSTLMRFVMQDPRTQSHLQHNSGPSAKWTCFGFFFHDRGSNIQKSLRGMLQELLFQLIGAFPHLFQCIEEDYKRLTKEQKTRQPNWDEPLLENCFRRVLNHAKSISSSTPFRTCLFIDALDEHAGDNERLLSLLADIANNQGNSEETPAQNFHVKVCLASRPWPLFKHRLAHCPQFAIHEYTKADIETYTKARLQDAIQTPSDSLDAKDLPRSSTVSWTSRQVQSLVETIIEKALGVFIWVRIVVEEVRSGIANGTPFFALEEIISNMPQELSELYTRALGKVEPPYVLEAHVMLRVALCALSPMPLSVFRAIVTKAVYDKHEKQMPLESLTAWLTSRTGGLLEHVSLTFDQPSHGMPTLNCDSIRSTPGEPIVQFIHQTVRDYLLTGSTGLDYDEAKAMGGEAEVDRFLAKTGNAHILNSIDEFGSILQPVTSEPQLRTLRDDFMRYAGLVDAEIDAGESELEYFPRLLWWTPEDAEFWLPEAFPYKEEILQPGPFCLYVALIGNLHNMFTNPKSGPAKSEHATLLHMAALGPRLFSERVDRPRMVKNLLDMGCDPGELFILSSLDLHRFWPELELLDETDTKPRNFVENLIQVLHHPAIDDDVLLSLAKLALNHQSVIITSDDLVTCATKRSIAWVKLLLEHGARWPISLRDHREIMNPEPSSSCVPLFSNWYRAFWSHLEDQGIQITSDSAISKDQLPYNDTVGFSNEFIFLTTAVSTGIAFPFVFVMHKQRDQDLTRLRRAYNEADRDPWIHPRFPSDHANTRP